MLKKAIHSAAWRAESLLDRIKGQEDTRRVIEPYLGYATPDHLIVRGRVLAALRRNQPVPEQSRWTNFKQMMSLFLTDEVGNVEVRAGNYAARSDEEGYFTLLLPRGDEVGWHDVPVTITGYSGTTPCPVLIASRSARFGVISDIDDTMMRTGAYSLARNLWTSFTGNAATRQVFPDSVALIRALSDGGRNPVFYVSSSPWNLHHFLSRVFERAGLTRGPKFLRDLGLSRTQFITGTHGDHKGGSIDTLVAAHPDLPFILIGDTGQHDAYVYHDAIERHRDQIAAVVLREPGPGPDEGSKTTMQAIEKTGTILLHGPTFDGFAEKLLQSERLQAA